VRTYGTNRECYGDNGARLEPMGLKKRHVSKELCNNNEVVKQNSHLKVGCLHPVVCTRSGSGFPSNATLVCIFYLVNATFFGLMTIFRRRPEDGHKTEICSGY
jgi:hypothetical protein